MRKYGQQFQRKNTILPRSSIWKKSFCKKILLIVHVCFHDFYRLMHLLQRIYPHSLMMHIHRHGKVVPTFPFPPRCSKKCDDNFEFLLFFHLSFLCYSESIRIFYYFHFQTQIQIFARFSGLLNFQKNKQHRFFDAFFICRESIRIH